MRLNLEIGLSKEERLFFSPTNTTLISSDQNEISLYFPPPPLVPSMLLVGFRCVVLGVVMVVLFCKPQTVLWFL